MHVDSDARTLKKEKRDSHPRLSFCRQKKTEEKTVHPTLTNPQKHHTAQVSFSLGQGWWDSSDEFPCTSTLFFAS
jgi:hypothetical protein